MNKSILTNIEEWVSDYVWMTASYPHLPDCIILATPEEDINYPCLLCTDNNYDTFSVISVNEKKIISDHCQHTEWVYHWLLRNYDDVKQCWINMYITGDKTPNRLDLK